MRKNELIKLLQEIEGNPEVMLWNGFVEDWQHIDKNFVRTNLYKQSKEFIAEMLDAEDIRDGVELTEERRQENKLQAIESFNKHYDWEFANQYLNESEYKKWYGNNIRPIILFQPKTKEKTSFDRFGSIKY